MYKILVLLCLFGLASQCLASEDVVSISEIDRAIHERKCFLSNWHSADDLRQLLSHTTDEKYKPLYYAHFLYHKILTDSQVAGEWYCDSEGNTDLVSFGKLIEEIRNNSPKTWFYFMPFLKQVESQAKKKNDLLLVAYLDLVNPVPSNIEIGEDDFRMTLLPYLYYKKNPGENDKSISYLIMLLRTPPVKKRDVLFHSILVNFILDAYTKDENSRFYYIYFSRKLGNPPSDFDVELTNGKEWFEKNVPAEIIEYTQKKWQAVSAIDTEQDGAAQEQ